MQLDNKSLSLTGHFAIKDIIQAVTYLRAAPVVCAWGCEYDGA